jgi:hypothetical protein
MTYHPDITSESTITANGGAARQLTSRNNRRSIANNKVVSNHIEIIEYHLIAYHSAFQSPAIDTEIASNFDIITYPYSTQLMDFLPVLFNCCKTIIVATKHRSRVANDYIASTDPILNANVRMNITVFTNLRIFTNHHTSDND